MKSIHDMKTTWRLRSIGYFIFILYFLTAITYYSSRFYIFEPFTQMVSPKYDYQKQENDYVILCLGGSTTNDNRLKEEEKYPYLLEQKLNGLGHMKNYKVINGGFDWYTTKHSLINYSTYYKQFKPDLVIVMHAINDLCRSFTPADFSIGEYKADYSHFYGPAANAANPPMLETYLLKKILGNDYYQILRWDLEPISIAQAQFKSLESYKQYYATLIKMILDDSSKCIIVEQASLYDLEMLEENKSLLWFGRTLCNNTGKEYPNYQSMYFAMNNFNDAADSLSNYFQIPFVHTSDSIPKTIDYFKDDVHHTPKTSQVLVDLIFPILLPYLSNESN